MSQAKWWGAVLTVVVATGAYGADAPCPAPVSGAKTASDCAAKPSRDSSGSDCRRATSGAAAAKCPKPASVAGMKAPVVAAAKAPAATAAAPAAACVANCNPKVATRLVKSAAGKPAARGATPGKDGDAAPLAIATTGAERRDPEDHQRLFERVEKFDEAVRAEARGQLRAAMHLYQDAAIEGYGPAQRRLGAIYQSGNAVVQRDYESALLWYERARANGEKITEPRRSIGFRTSP